MKLTTRQKNTLVKHQKTHGHTKAHMDYMKRKMREGMSFTEAHNMAMRRKGNGSTYKKTKRNIKSSFSASHKKAHELYG